MGKSMHLNILVLWFIMVFVGSPVIAEGYIGPGLGAGTIAAILGVLGSIFLALLAVLYYPIKRLFKKRKDEKS